MIIIKLGLFLLVIFMNCEGNSRYASDVMVAKFLDKLKKSPFIFYKVHEFIFKPQSWFKYTINLRDEYQIEILQKYSDREIRTVFKNLKLDDDVSNGVRFYAINFEVAETDLFENPKDWVISYGGQTQELSDVLSGGDLIITDTTTVSLKKIRPKSDRFEFEFQLGDEIRTIMNSAFRDLQGGHVTGPKNFHLVFAEPRLEFLAKGKFEKIKYQCFLHAIENHEVQEVGFRTDEGPESDIDHFIKEAIEGIIPLIVRMTIKHPEILKNKIKYSASLTYRYQDIALLIRDHLDGLKVWMKGVGPNKVQVDAFGVVKAVFTDPYSLFTFDKKGNLKDVHHGLGLGPAPYVDMSRGGVWPHSVQEGKFDDNPELSDWIDMRIQSMFERVHSEEIGEDDLEGFRQWMISTLREDFRKFRDPDDTQTYYVADEAFVAKTRVKNYSIEDIVITGLK